MTTRSATEVQTEIAILQREQSNLRPLPNIQALENALAVAGAKAQVDINLKGELFHADQLLKDGQAAHRRNAEIGSELRVLEAELAQIEALDRKYRIDTANAALNTLHNEFNVTAQQLCRIYERMLIQSRRNSLVPGASISVPGAFDLPGMKPDGWQGKTSELIQSGSLYWLNKEKEQAA